MENILEEAPENTAGLAIRPFCDEDLVDMVEIWNEVVEAGNAFPQIETLASKEEAAEFFRAQTLTAVADLDGKIAGLYILHPNNVGRCSHIANASYAVASSARGLGLGRALVEDSLVQAGRKGFRGMQFNAVVASNDRAIRLYESIGFARIGTIPQGFLNGQGDYEDMHVFYKDCACS